MKAAEKPVTHTSQWGCSLVLWSTVEMTSLLVFQGKCHITQLLFFTVKTPCFVLKNVPLREIYYQSMTSETGESDHDEKRQRQMMP